MAMLTNNIIPDIAKLLCTWCGAIIQFIGETLQQGSSCETSFRVSLSMLIGVTAPAVRCPVGRGRNITVYTTDTDEVKLEWLTPLLCGLITLLKEYIDPQLESFTSGGQADCTILTILRSLSHGQFEELRPYVDIHPDCTEDICHGLTPMGRNANSDNS